MLDPDERYHIENRLGRPLTEDDLAQASSFDDLSRAQLTIIERLVPRGPLANSYVRTVVPSADRSDVREFVYNIETFVDKKFPPAQLRMEHIYGHQLGRPLTDEERARIDSLQAISQAQLAVAKQLASRELVFCQLYLADIVRSGGARERELLAEELRRASQP